MIHLTFTPQGVFTSEEMTIKGYTIPKGFEFDGMSVPAFLRSFTGGNFRKRTLRAALLHDYLYRKQHVSREIADKIFLRTLREDKVFMSWTLYAGVLFFGWFAWRANQKRHI